MKSGTCTARVAFSRCHILKVQQPQRYPLGVINFGRLTPSLSSIPLLTSMFKMQLKLVNGSVCDWILICHQKKKVVVIYTGNDSWEQNALTGTVVFLIFGCLALACNLWRFCSCLGEAFQSLDEETLEAMAKHETEEDKIFQMFKERVAAEPEQVRRWGSLRTYRFWHSVLLHLQNVSLPFISTVRNGGGDASSSSTHLNQHTLIFLTCRTWLMLK